MLIFVDEASDVSSCVHSDRKSWRQDANHIENREQPSCSCAKRFGHKRQH